MRLNNELDCKLDCTTQSTDCVARSWFGLLGEE